MVQPRDSGRPPTTMDGRPEGGRRRSEVRPAMWPDGHQCKVKYIYNIYNNKYIITNIYIYI